MNIELFFYQFTNYYILFKSFNDGIDKENFITCLKII